VIGIRTFRGFSSIFIGGNPNRGFRHGSLGFSCRQSLPHKLNLRLAKRPNQLSKRLKGSNEVDKKEIDLLV